MITNFWNWMFQSVQNAVNTLETIYTNTTIKPFVDLFLVVIGVAVILKYIIAPLIGFNYAGATDKAARRGKKTAVDAEYKEVD